LISFRYHIVSIVAVFLALALGVLLGTTVVNQGVIDDLSRRTNNAAKRSEQLRSQVAELQSEVTNWDRFGAAVEPLLIAGQLASRQVVVVTQEGVDAAEVAGVRKAFQDAGATVVSVLVVTNRMAVPDDGARDDLSSALGVTGAGDVADLSVMAARELGTRLSTGPTSATSDLLQKLVDTGFVVLRGGTGTIEQIGRPEQAVSVLAGGGREPILAPATFLAPLIESLVDGARPVVAAETAQTVYPFVGLLRRDGALDQRLVTVDNADTMPGRIAVVLGLRNLLEDPAKGGDFGVKGGASSLIPQP
jgi:hypothetical protein